MKALTKRSMKGLIEGFMKELMKGSIIALIKDLMKGLPGFTGDIARGQHRSRRSMKSKRQARARRVAMGQRKSGKMVLEGLPGVHAGVQGVAEGIATEEQSHSTLYLSGSKRAPVCRGPLRKWVLLGVAAGSEAAGTRSGLSVKSP